jgi:flagellar biosynthesis protein FliR
METLTIYMTIMIFMEMGGFHLIITTFKHSFDVMPLFSTSPNIFSVLKMETFLTLSGSAIEIAVQLMASIMVFTMAFDIILALVNRTAQQIPVYQLGMALKPLFTLGLFLVIMQMFNNSLHRHLEMYRTLF